MNNIMTLTNAERGLVRKAIKVHPLWPAWRQEHGVTMADMTSSRCIEFATFAEMDLTAVLNGEDDDMTDEEHDEIRKQFEQEEVEAEVVAQAVKPQPVQEAPEDLTGALLALKKALGGSVDADAVRAIVEEAIAPLRTQVQDAAPVILIKSAPDADPVKLEGLRHERFDTLLAACMARDTSGRPLNVWLAGPSQSGKTTAAEMVAKALDLPFSFHGAMTMPHELTGFVDAGGKYHETQFVRAYRDGGVCLLDEVDAGSNEALLCLNAALANGQMPLPTGDMIERHADFVCIGAANTWGVGATAEYVGRAKLDAAFLQRFPIKIDWPYDEKLERKFCGNPDWAMRVQSARKSAQKAGLKVLITPAHSKAGAALIAAGMSEDDAAKLTYLAGLTDAQVAQVEG